MLETPIFSPLALHIAAASVALFVGPLAIYRKRRDARHKMLGYVWVVAIAVTALSSFLLSAAILPIAFGLGPIHLLSIWALWTIWFGVRDARAGRMAAHRARMAGLYWQGLTLAGLFTLLPGRIINDFLFGANPQTGLWMILGLGAGLLWINLHGSLKAPSAAEQRPR